MNNQHPSSAPPPPTKTPGSSILSLAALAEFTKHHPASPRTTVQEYLRDQRTRSFAPVVFARAPSPALPRGSHIPSPHQRRRPSPPEGAAELALVLHRETAEEGKENGRGSGKRAREEGEERRGVKKVSLVAAMRPRLSSQPAVSPVGSLEEEKEKKGDVGGEGMKENGDTSSPLLVARADMDGDEEEAGPQDDGQEEVVKPKKRERRVVAEEKKPRAEEERSPAAPAKAGGSRRKKPDKSDTLESEEDREVMERLDARKERRRSKALIVKDRTQSARATGAAAAAKLKASTSRRKSKKTAEADDGDETGSGEEEEDRRKKKRRTSNEEVNRHVQDVHKAKNVGGSRLTLRPAVKLGIFNKGAASVRTKVGKQLPDLAFSELNFLNTPRPPPPPSSSSSSSSSSAHIVSKSKASAKPPRNSSSSHPPKALVTYGKGKKPSSKYFKPPPPDLDSSSIDSPPPPPKAKAKSKVVAPHHQPSKKKSKAKAARKSPPPAPSLSVAEDDDSAQHSAYSLRQRPAKEQPVVVPHEDSVDEGLAPSEAVLDTSHAWQNGFSKAASSRAAPVATSPCPSLHQSHLRHSPLCHSPLRHSPLRHSPVRRSHFAPSDPLPLSSLAGSSSINRMLKACATGDLIGVAQGSLQFSSAATPSFRQSSMDPPGPIENLWDSAALGAGSDDLGGIDSRMPLELGGRVNEDERVYEEGDLSQSPELHGFEGADDEGVLDRENEVCAGTDVVGEEGSWRDVRLEGMEDDDDEEMRHELFGEEEDRLDGPPALSQYSSSVLEGAFAGGAYGGVDAGGERGRGMDAEFATAMRSHWYRAKP